MILKLRVENMKDATGDKKRVMFATLVTDITGIEKIDAVAELDEECQLGKEITQLITNMLALKQKSLKEENKGFLSRLKEKREKKKKGKK